MAVVFVAVAREMCEGAYIHYVVRARGGRDDSPWRAQLPLAPAQSMARMLAFALALALAQAPSTRPAAGRAVEVGGDLEARSVPAVLGACGRSDWAQSVAKLWARTWEVVVVVYIYWNLLVT